jgi:hypothetical protein
MQLPKGGVEAIPQEFSQRIREILGEKHLLSESADVVRERILFIMTEYGLVFEKGDVYPILSYTGGTLTRIEIPLGRELERLIFP